MRIVYRMRGLLGDATEEFIESLDSTTGMVLFTGRAACWVWDLGPVSGSHPGTEGYSGKILVPLIRGEVRLLLLRKNTSIYGLIQHPLGLGEKMQLATNMTSDLFLA